MRWMTLLMLAAAALVPAASAHEKCSAAECAEVKARIEAIESKMRAGYTNAQGRRYEDQLRALKAKRYKLCR